MRNPNEYLEIDCGYTLDTVIEHFQHMNRAGLKRKMQFNGKWLYSDMTTDEIYLEVTGKTKQDFEDDCREARLKYEREKEEFRANAPSIIEKYKRLGEGIIPFDKIESWNNIVEESIINGIYEGADLDATLEILKHRDNVNKARETFINQGHSNISSGIVCSEIRALMDNADEFIEVINS